MAKVISNTYQANPEWLSDLFYEKGMLRSGAIITSQKRPNLLHTAEATYLKLRYSEDATGVLPDAIFVKLGTRRAEVEFYNRIAVDMQGIAPACYEAAYDTAGGKTHFILEDLLVTHTALDETLPPSYHHAQMIVDTLAEIHAYWWQNPRLDNEINAVAEDVPGNIKAQSQAAFPAFVDFLGDRLSDERRHLFERILENVPLKARHDRLQKGQRVTLIHGDAHAANFLFPNDSQLDRVRVQEWQSWYIGVGADDLAALMARNWYSDQRRRSEEGLLRFYHERLQAFNVSGYSLDDLWLDYRYSVVQTMLYPVFQWNAKHPASRWWRNLECLFTAFHDLGCAELLA